MLVQFHEQHGVLPSAEHKHPLPALPRYLHPLTWVFGSGTFNAHQSTIMRPLFHCAKNDRKQPKEEEEAGSDFTHSNFPPLFRASGARVSMTLQFAAIHRSTQNAFGRSPPPPIVACSDARQPDGVRAVQRPARTDSFAPLITRQGEHPVRQTVAALYTYDGPLSLFLSCQPKKRQSGRKRSHMEKTLVSSSETVAAD